MEILVKAAGRVSSSSSSCSSCSGSSRCGGSSGSSSGGGSVSSSCGGTVDGQNPALPIIRNIPYFP